MHNSILLMYINHCGRIRKLWIVIPKNWTYSVNADKLIIDEDFTGVSGREYKIELSGNVYKDGYSEPISETHTKTCP